jgi:hypothetical protein
MTEGFAKDPELTELAILDDEVLDDRYGKIGQILKKLLYILTINTTI